MLSQPVLQVLPGRCSLVGRGDAGCLLSAQFSGLLANHGYDGVEPFLLATTDRLTGAPDRDHGHSVCQEGAGIQMVSTTFSVSLFVLFF